MADTYRDAVAEIATLRQELEALKEQVHRDLEQIHRLQRELAQARDERDKEQRLRAEAEAAIIRAQDALTSDHPVFFILDDYDGSHDSVQALKAERDAAMVEVATLRQELDAANTRIEDQSEQIRLGVAQIHGLQRELAQARDERDKEQRLRVEAQSVLDQALRAGDRQTTVEAWIQRDEAIAQRDRLRTAARHVVDCYRHADLMATVVAVDRLGEVLDGGT